MNPPVQAIAPRLHLGVLLATGPGEAFGAAQAQGRPSPSIVPPSPAKDTDATADRDDFTCVDSALRGALAQGGDASLFLMDQGVCYAADPRLLPLIAAGVDVALCASDAEAHGLDLDLAAARGILLGSQHDHARLVRDCDRFLSFT